MTKDLSKAPRSSGFAARRYDRLAPLYGAISVAFGLRPAVRRAAVEQLALAPGDSVLEVGCGRGDNLELLRAAVGESGRVVGTDVSAGMLARAEERCRRGGWANVRLLKQAAERLSVPGCFDAVLFALQEAALGAEVEVAPATRGAVVDRRLASAGRAPGPAPAQAHRDQHTLGAEGDSTDRGLLESQELVECRADAHVRPFWVADLLTASSLQAGTAARLSRSRTLRRSGGSTGPRLRAQLVSAATGR